MKSLKVVASFIFAAGIMLAGCGGGSKNTTSGTGMGGGGGSATSPTTYYCFSGVIVRNNTNHLPIQGVKVIYTESARGASSNPSYTDENGETWFRVGLYSSDGVSTATFDLSSSDFVSTKASFSRDYKDDSCDSSDPWDESRRRTVYVYMSPK